LEKNDRGGSCVEVWIIDGAINLNLTINGFNQVLVAAADFCPIFWALK
jgi:hypothetical protein